MKKIIVVGICYLLIVITFSGCIEETPSDEDKTPTVESKIFYVDDDGEGNFTNIQDAIDEANNSDTVYVYNGIYFENVLIDKTIHLRGENKETTIIDGNGDANVVNVTADGVNISGFTIRNAGNRSLYKYYDAGIHLYSDYNTIFENKIIDNEINGIVIDRSEHNNIKNNLIKNNKHTGIKLDDGDNNTISGNSISDSDNGIEFFIYCDYNTIAGNIISSCQLNGLNIWKECDLNTVMQNEILNCQGSGIFLYASSNNTLIQNSISSNHDEGIYLKSGIIFSSFNVSWNGTEIIEQVWYYSNDNILFHNNFIDNNPNVLDDGNNTWDNGYSSGGNYWSDYNGGDSNDDGIGDTTYRIFNTNGMSFNTDRYPLMDPVDIN